MYQPPSFSLQWIVARSSMHCTNQEIALTSYFLTHCFALNSSHNYNKKKTTTLLVSWEAVSFFFPSSNLDVSSDFASGKHRDSRKTLRFLETHRVGILGKHRDFRKHKWTRFSENSDIFGNTSRFSKTHRDSRKISRFSETHRDSRKHIVILGNASRFSENIDIFGTTKLTACLEISNQMYSVQYQNVYAHKTYP